MTVQQGIKKLRAKLNLSQEGLARKMSIGVRTMARYENDAPPTGKALRRFINLATELDENEVKEVFARALDARIFRRRLSEQELQELADQHSESLRVIGHLFGLLKKNEKVIYPFDLIDAYFTVTKHITELSSAADKILDGRIRQAIEDLAKGSGKMTIRHDTGVTFREDSAE